MRIFLLGGTGSIGTSITRELLNHHHEVVALARSDASEAKLRLSGAEVVRGDLRGPVPWCGQAVEADVIVHVAATFTEDMGAVDRAVIEAMIAAAKAQGCRPKLIYTGGCWLYGETGDWVALEGDELHPIPAFGWMKDNHQLALSSGVLETVLIHPAMVYDRDGGVLTRFFDSHRQTGQIEVWGRLETRWPVVHRDDLATAYRLAAELGAAGEIYNVAAETGVTVSSIVSALQVRLGSAKAPRVRARQDVVAEHGDWAVGPTLDQQMSGEKIRDGLGWSPVHHDILRVIG